MFDLIKKNKYMIQQDICIVMCNDCVKKYINVDVDVDVDCIEMNKNMFLFECE